MMSRRSPVRTAAAALLLAGALVAAWPGPGLGAETPWPPADAGPAPVPIPIPAPVPAPPPDRAVPPAAGPPSPTAKVGTSRERQTVSVARLVEAFRRLAFRSAGKSRTAGRAPLTRWQGPIAATLSGAAADAYRPAVEALFGEMQKLTGLPFVLVDGETPASLRIRFLPAADLRRILRDTRSGQRAMGTGGTTPCLGSFATADPTPGGGAPGPAASGPAAPGKIAPDDTVPGHVIVSADVVIGLSTARTIGRAEDRRIRRCLHRELGRVLGLSSSRATVWDSVFNDANGARGGFSVSDHILIRALYDRRLVAGMAEDDALPIVREVIRQLVTRLVTGR